MKKIIFMAAAGFLITASAGAQTDSTKHTMDSTKHNAPVNSTTTTSSTTSTTTSTQTNVPDNLKGVTSETLRPENYLPALGHYQAGSGSTGDITVSLDPENKGIVWIEGLPQGKAKALLLKSPGIYKIPAQKTADGKMIPEGVLYADPATNQVSIELGAPYDSANPTAIFANDTDNNMDVKSVKVKGSVNGKKVKEKVKPWKYNGVKVKESGSTSGTAQQ